MQKNSFKNPTTSRNVLFLARRFYPHLGGVETHVMRVGQELSKKGYTVTVITEQYDEHLPLHEVINHIRVMRIDQSSLESKWTVWNWFFAHREVLKSAGLIHAHDVYWWYLPFRLRYFWKPTFLTFHGWEGVYPPRMGAILSRKLMTALAKKNIAVGDYIETWYGTRADVILYGAPSIQARPSRRKNIRQIVFVGRLANENLVREYIRAFRLLKRKLPALSISFLGDGPLRNEAKQVGTVLGMLPTESPKYQETLATAGWIWASSYLSIFDGLASGAPVFCLFDHPLKRDVLCCFPAKEIVTISQTAERLCEAFLMLAKNSTAYEEKQSNGILAAKQYSWRTVAKEYERLWGL